MTTKFAAGSAVGFGNPPVKTRFKKLTSGNPKGRPRHSQSMAAVAGRLFDTKIPVRACEKTINVPYFLALVHTLKAGALSGQTKATRALSFLMEALGHYSAEPEPEKQGVLVLSGVHPDEEEWLACVALREMRKEKKRRAAMEQQRAVAPRPVPGST
jgi:hypothetical protein